ncbi:TPA: tetratricopeptide repeat protein [Candidatus Poribacteria bacterium]|nr:tetratricopeptide repeat protein [Candidatus Poribacteria bacterium]
MKAKPTIFLLLLVFFLISAIPSFPQESAMDKKAFEKAVKRYRKTVRKDEKNLELHRRMIESAYRANSISVPLYIYQESYKKHPNHPIVLYVLGYTHLTKGTEESLTAAENYLKQALENEPNLVDAHAALGRCYLKQGQKELALEELEASIRLDHKFAPAYLDLARYYSSERSYQKAISNYKESLKLDEKSFEGHFELGEIYFDMKDYASAEGEFLKALTYARSEDEKVAKAYYKLGQIRAWQNRPEEAIDFYKKGKRYASNPAPRYKLANIFLDVDNIQYAIRSLQSALALDPRYADEVGKLKDLSSNEVKDASAVETANIIKEMLVKNPNNSQLQYFVGKLQLKLGDTTSAKEHLEKAKELAPSDEEIRAQLGEVYERENEPEKATEEYKQAAELGKAQLPVLLHLADTYRKEGDEAKFIETVEQILAIDPKHPDLQFELAVIYERKANEEDRKNTDYLFAKAVERAHQAAMLAPNNGKYRLKLADLYAKQGKLKALKTYEEAIALAPNSAEAYAGRAAFMLNYRFGAQKALLYDPEDILADLKKAIQLDPNLAGAHYSLGIIYDRMGSIDKAISEFETTVKLDETNYKAYLYLAEKYANGNEPMKAIDAFAKAIKYDRNNVEALKDFAFLTLKYNEAKWRDAKAALKRALEINADDPEALMNYGYTLYLDRDFAGAIENYLHALRFDPNSAQLHYNLALAYDANGQKTVALQEWRKVVDLDPDGRFGMTALERIVALGEKP